MRRIVFEDEVRIPNHPERAKVEPEEFGGCAWLCRIVRFDHQDPDYEPQASFEYAVPDEMGDCSWRPLKHAVDRLRVATAAVLTMSAQPVTTPSAPLFSFEECDGA
jgi:hypothetical protein